MPISELKFQPGINREVTNYAGKGGYYDCNKIRFRANNPEKIGGWANPTRSYTYNGIVRTLWNWFTIAGENLIAFGTNQKYYIQPSNGSSYNDITPTTAKTLSVTNPITTTSGIALITILDSTAVTVGTFIKFTGGPYTVGGVTIPTNGTYEIVSLPLLPSLATTAASGTAGTATISFTAQTYAPPIGSSVTISGVTPLGYNGTYVVTASTTSSVSFTNATTGSQTVAGTIAFSISGYQIIGPSIATSTAAGGGASVPVTFELNAGSAIVSSSSGWGSGGWGISAWGASSGTTTPLRLWSQCNFGDDLVMAYRAGPIYYWTKNTSTYPAAVTINTKASSVVKTQQTVTVGVTAGASGSSFTIANSQGVDYGATLTLISGSGSSSIPTGTYVALSPTYTGYTVITVVIPSGTITLAPGDIVGFSYSGKCAPNETNQIIISSANQFTIALGSTPYDPSNATPAFSPTLVRWSDQSIPYEWTPSTSNQSGEQTLASGSYIVGGLSTRQEILIWTDRALYSMQYIGPPFIFTFQLMMDNISIVSQNAAITVNGATYWMGVDKFYVYNGTVQPLPCSVRKYIFSNLNFSQQSQVVCGQNEGFNEIWWFYPSTSSLINDSYVIYNYLENSWYYGTLNRTAWLNSSLQSYPLAAFSIQTSYLSAAITSSTATSISLLDSSTYPSSGIVIIDNEQISYTSNSGNSLSGCTRGYGGSTATTHLVYTQVTYYIPNQILQHENGYDDASPSTGVQPITSYLQTSDFDISGGDRFGYVWRFLPDFTFQGSTVTNPQIYLTLNPRNNSGLSYLTGGDIGNVADSTVTNTQVAPPAPNTYPVEQYTGALYTRIRGRQMNFYIQSTGTGVFWQMGTMRFDMRADGRR